VPAPRSCFLATRRCFVLFYFYFMFAFVSPGSKIDKCIAPIDSRLFVRLSAHVLEHSVIYVSCLYNHIQP